MTVLQYFKCDPILHECLHIVGVSAVPVKLWEGKEVENKFPTSNYYMLLSICINFMCIILMRGSYRVCIFG